MIALESLASSERRMKALQFSRFGSPDVLAYQAVARGDAHGRVVLIPAATS
jgi:hypothetical protein